MNKHTATYNGATFTRNSAGRTYSHVVLVVETEAQHRARCERTAKARQRVALKHGEVVTDYDAILANVMKWDGFKANTTQGEDAGMWSWAGRADLAEAQARKARSVYPEATVVVVPAEVRH